MAISPLSQYTCDIDAVIETVPAGSSLPAGWSVVDIDSSLTGKKEYVLCPTHTQKINAVLAGTL